MAFATFTDEKRIGSFQIYFSCSSSTSIFLAVLWCFESRRSRILNRNRGRCGSIVGFKKIHWGKGHHGLGTESKSGKNNQWIRRQRWPAQRRCYGKFVSGIFLVLSLFLRLIFLLLLWILLFLYSRFCSDLFFSLRFLCFGCRDWGRVNSSSTNQSFNVELWWLCLRALVRVEWWWRCGIEAGNWKMQVESDDWRRVLGPIHGGWRFWVQWFEEFVMRLKNWIGDGEGLLQVEGLKSVVDDWWRLKKKLDGEWEWRW